MNTNQITAENSLWNWVLKTSPNPGMRCEAANRLEQILLTQNPKITRQEARDAIMLQLRKWREDGQDHIYFGALTIAPDLDEDTTFGELIDIVFDS